MIAVFTGALILLVQGSVARELRGALQRRGLNGNPVGLNLINAADGSIYASLFDGAEVTVESGSMTNFNVVAEVDGAVGFITFHYNGVQVRKEKVAPYAMCGDRNGNFFKCDYLGIGTHTVTATSHTDGTQGSSFTVNFTLVNGDVSMPPSASPTEASMATISPTGAPTSSPVTLSPVVATTAVPTGAPTSSPVTLSPVVATTAVPTGAPTTSPSTAAPVASPVTSSPTGSPTNTPTIMVTTETPTQTEGVLALTLINTDTNEEIMDILDGTIVDMVALQMYVPNFNIQAVTSPEVQSVRFSNGRKETLEPFAFCGDHEGRFFTCDGFADANIVTVGATATLNDGTVLLEYSVTFEIIPNPLPQAGGAWIETEANAPIEARHEACFVMVDNPVIGRRAILVGGRGQKDTELFDPVSNTWTKGKRPPIQMHHMQCVAAQGKLWVLGVWTDWYPHENNASKSYVYDPVTDKWSPKSTMSLARRRGSTAVMVSNDETKIYVSHGNSGGHETGGNHAVSLGLLDEYDIATNTWTALSDSAPNPRDHGGGAMMADGRICIAGGRNGGELEWPTVAPTDCFNFSTGEWEVEAPIPQMRGGSAYGQTCDGKLMVAGGEGNGQAYDNVAVFDGKGWVLYPPLNKGRHGTGLAVDCVCDQILIASGALNAGGGPETTSVETYFPSGVATVCSF